MNSSAMPASPRRLNKLARRIQKDGINKLPGWAARWLYWNAHVYQLIPPSDAKRLRLAYKYRRPNKKYGIHVPIIVYHMGKVASTTVYHSLLAMDLDVPVDACQGKCPLAGDSVRAFESLCIRGNARVSWYSGFSTCQQKYR
jgi:hypothetical protein